MRIAFTTSGETPEAPLESRFGRAPRFLIHDTGTGGFEVLENRQNLDAAQGAGIQSAMALCRAGVDAVVTGHCGPKAFATLDAANVAVHPASGGTVGEALQRFLRGELEQAEAADVEGHWI